MGEQQLFTYSNIPSNLSDLINEYNIDLIGVPLLQSFQTDKSHNLDYRILTRFSSEHRKSMLEMDRIFEKVYSPQSIKQLITDAGNIAMTGVYPKIEQIRAHINPLRKEQNIRSLNWRRHPYIKESAQEYISGQAIDVIEQTQQDYETTGNIMVIAPTQIGVAIQQLYQERKHFCNSKIA